MEVWLLSLVYWLKKLTYRCKRKPIFLVVASDKDYDILMELNASNHEFSGQKDLIFLGQNHTKRVTVVLGLVFLWCATHYANLSKLSCCSTSYSQNAQWIKILSKGKSITVYPRLFSTLKKFSPLNSFHSIYCIKVKLLRKLWKYLHILTSKKNSFCGNYLRKYSMFFMHQCFTNIFFQYLFSDVVQ